MPPKNLDLRAKKNGIGNIVDLFPFLFRVHFFCTFEQRGQLHCKAWLFAAEQAYHGFHRYCDDESDDECGDESDDERNYESDNERGDESDDESDDERTSISWLSPILCRLFVDTVATHASSEYIKIFGIYIVYY